ncbi:hypothetical protein WN51_01127 [Melipona quadrifasciata]|uniref:PiggyBac transposable element-derived protein 4 n=1 Tax=Melipona quadrifasciata TaxID=166423 RepID=A0A0M8ZXR0_9HYME|nr:hypothetical protein WN51_01127 [Melipona quadrifasciata]
MTHRNRNKIKLMKVSSKTVALTIAPKLVETWRSWRKHQKNLQRNEQPLTHLHFRKILVRGDFRQPRDRASRSTSNSDGIRRNEKLRVILTVTKKDCKVCSSRNKPGGRHKTTYYCDTCPDKPRMYLYLLMVGEDGSRNLQRAGDDSGKRHDGRMIYQNSSHIVSKEVEFENLSSISEQSTDSV